MKSIPWQLISPSSENSALLNAAIVFSNWHSFISSEKLISPDYSTVLWVFTNLLSCSSIKTFCFSIYSATINQCLRYLEYQFSHLCALCHDLVHLVLLNTEDVLHESWLKYILLNFQREGFLKLRFLYGRCLCSSGWGSNLPETAKKRWVEVFPDANDWYSFCSSCAGVHWWLPAEITAITCQDSLMLWLGVCRKVLVWDKACPAAVLTYL